MEKNFLLSITTFTEDIVKQVGPKNYNNILFELLISIFILGIFIVFTLILLKFFKNLRYSKMYTRNLRCIESINLSFGCYIQLIKVCEKYILIAINKENVTFLMELNEADLKINENMNKNNFFEQYISNYLNKIPKKAN